jgi:hypothetical protein
MSSSRRLPFLAQLAFVAATVGAATGCSTLSPPFNQMKGAQMTVYRLQNYVPPGAPQAAPSIGGMAIPPQIQQWIAAGASLIPPGLLPPGLLPGTTAPAVQADTPRFPPGPQGFPILGYQPVSDPSLANEILETLGHASNYQPPTQSCMYAELGIAIGQAGNPQPADFLVSLSCQQIQASGITWPYPNTGLDETSERQFASILQRAFGGR